MPDHTGPIVTEYERIAVSKFRHHWTFTRDPDDSEWGGVKTLARALMAGCPSKTAAGMPLRGRLITYATIKGVQKEFPVDHDNPALLDLTLDGVEVIQFNGVEPLACEAFSMPRCMDEQSVDTRARPYDDLVLALFILIEDAFPGLLKVDSPAGLDDWESGLRAAQCVFGTVRINTRLLNFRSDQAALAVQRIVIDRPASLDFTR